MNLRYNLDHRRVLALVCWGMLGFLAAVATAGGAPSSSLAPAPQRVDYNRDVRPILSDNCFACHGFDSRKRKAGLRLDVPEGAFQPNKDGRVAIKPGDLEHSEAWKRINSSDPEEIMPPQDSHKTLAASQKEILRRWILQKAPYQKHWAFLAPVKPVPPRPERTRNVRNAVDQFLLERLQREHLGFSPEADRRTLIRRLSFDLRGLPPSLAEIDTFLADRRPDAYERCVDRLLDSVHYGEQMARHWLDVARYADTHGMHLDNERSMWPYRDWVVKAFNRNLPYDQFTVEQIAGDLLPSPTQEQLVATGFNRCNVTTGEGGNIEAEQLFRYAVERTTTTVQAWMGLTAGCAVCHDHKYDPLSMREFYSLYAFFNSAADPASDGNVRLTPPIVKLRTGRDEKQLAEYDAEIKAAETRLDKAIATVAYRDPAIQEPQPSPRPIENIWLEDDFPGGGKTRVTGAATQWVTADKGQVFSGRKALRREDKEFAEDACEFEQPTLEMPARARLFAYVYLDPTNAPKSILLQYRRGGWEHRAVWGDADAIDKGVKGTAGRIHRGSLPRTGVWTRLEIDAEQLGFKPGDLLRGFSLGQLGGTVYWDKVGVQGEIPAAADEKRSFVFWQKRNDGKEPAGLPDNLRKIFKETSSTNRSPEQAKALRDYFLSRVCLDLKSTFDPLHAGLDTIRNKRSTYENAIPGSFIFRDLEKPRESYVMVRGQYDKPGDKVTRGVPAVLPPLRNTSPSNQPNRLDLARWLVSDEHPLVARVAVNRFWQQFFGTGLVKSSDNFGLQGEPPSHPELLDWLAVHFRESGWDIKALVKLLVTSTAYRQSSRIAPELLQRDPENRWLARGPRFRLDAEQIRDNALSAAGLIDLTVGGRGARPYQPPNIWEPVAYVDSDTRSYNQGTGSALYRRSLYCFLKRTAPPPFLSTFDAPNREQFCTRRERSNTPLQALQLLNDVQHFEAARALAQRMILEGGGSLRDRIRFGYRTVLARPPARKELAIIERAFQQHLARYQAAPEAAREAVAFGESKPRAGLNPVELAAYTLTANLLLNLDETITHN